jgi:hypothetical protein
MEAKHDNIVPMLGITEGFSEEGFAMVSPWMNGGTLTQYLQVHAGKIHSRKKLILVGEIVARSSITLLIQIFCSSRILLKAWHIVRDEFLCSTCCTINFLFFWQYTLVGLYMATSPL